MPKLFDANLEKMNTTSNFGFSATRIDELEATEYTLVNIVTDVSGSVGEYKEDLEKCISEIVTACQKSPRADNLMIRLSSFDDKVQEEHGYKLLQNINPGDYIGSLTIGGMTALYDSVVESLETLDSYSENLVNNDYDCNAIVFVITDGMDNRSKFSPSKIKETLSTIIRSERVESIVSVLIGVGAQDYPDLQRYLEDLKQESNMDEYREIGEADSKSLAKIAEFVSQSISSQSNALGSGGPSQAIQSLSI
jgi:uncharacterized protein YegL